MPCGTPRRPRATADRSAPSGDDRLLLFEILGDIGEPVGIESVANAQCHHRAISGFSVSRNDRTQIWLRDCLKRFGADRTVGLVRPIVLFPAASPPSASSAPARRSVQPGLSGDAHAQLLSGRAAIAGAEPTTKGNLE